MGFLNSLRGGVLGAFGNPHRCGPKMLPDHLPSVMPILGPLPSQDCICLSNPACCN